MSELEVSSRPGPWWRPNAGLLLLIAVYAVLLVVYRPLSALEWDEILFVRSMDRYDMAAHSPHPPGYPVFVGAAKPIFWLTGNAQLALQVVSMSAAIAALSLVWLLARRLGSRPREATCAAALLAATPGFVFNANVGMSDVLGTASALAGILALVAAWDRAERLPLAAAVCAVALGVRPQIALMVVPVFVVVVIHAARAGRWRAVVGAVAGGVATSLACWMPAVLLTGPARFLDALRGQFRWIVEVDHSGQFSRASLGTLADRWLVAPFGFAGLASVFWVLVAAGALVHWRAGKRRLVAVCLAAGGGYLVLAMWTLHIAPSVRYVLPAIPFLALLAAGVASGPAPLRRRGAEVAIAAWCVIAVLVVAGAALDVRPRRPAPVSAPLTWVAASFDPARTTVVHSDGLGPHATLELEGKGFSVVAVEPGELRPPGLPPGTEVLLVSTRPVPGTEILLDRHWKVPQLTRLSRGMYDRCIVARAPPTVPTPDPTTRALASAASGTRMVVPAAASGWGRLRSFWTTDLALHNPDPERALSIELTVIGRPGSAAAPTRATALLAAGDTVVLEDVLRERLSFSGGAALELHAARPFIALWRTYDRTRAGGGAPEMLPALLPGAAATSGRLDLGAVWPERDGARCNVGFVNLGERAAVVELAVGTGKGTATRRIRVPVSASMQVDDIAAASPPPAQRVVFQASSAVLAYAAVVETNGGRVSYVFP